MKSRKKTIKSSGLPKNPLAKKDFLAANKYIDSILLKEKREQEIEDEDELNSYEYPEMLVVVSGTSVFILSAIDNDYTYNWYDEATYEAALEEGRGEARFLETGMIDKTNLGDPRGDRHVRLVILDGKRIIYKDTEGYFFHDKYKTEEEALKNAIKYAKIRNAFLIDPKKYK